MKKRYVFSMSVAASFAIFGLAGGLLFCFPADWLGRAGTARHIGVVSDESKQENGSKPDLQAAYGKLPLSFEVNHGQTQPQVKFLSRGNGYAVYLTATNAILQLRSAKPNGSKLKSPVSFQS